MLAVLCLVYYFLVQERFLIVTPTATQGKTVKAVKNGNLTIQYAAFKLYNNSNLNGVIMFLREEQSYSTTATLCGKLCLTTPTCCGFFYKQNDSCRLVAKPKRDLVVHSMGTSYFEKVSKCTVDPNICNAGTCVPHYQNNSYTCDCHEKVSGTHCNTGRYSIKVADDFSMYLLDYDQCFHADFIMIFLYVNTGHKIELALRFQLYGITSFNNVTSAKLKFTSEVDNTEFPYAIKITAVKTSSMPGEINNLVNCAFVNASRTKEIIWDGPHPAKNVGDITHTPDISDVINEAIKMSDWKSENYVTFVFSNRDLHNFDADYQYKKSYIFFAEGNYRPVLELSWT